MPDPQPTQPPTYADVRWRCPGCGRFIAESALRSWDEIDWGAYYGVVGITVTTCSRCGEVEPQCIPVRFYVLEDCDAR